MLLLIPSTFIYYYYFYIILFLEKIFSYPQTAKKATALFSQSLRYK